MVTTAAVLVWLSFLGSVQADAGARKDRLGAVREFRQAHEAEILQEFVELLRIPNVATDRENILRNARHIQDLFAQRGVQLEVLQLPQAAPLVWGRLETPGAKRTLGVYVHYDGQPAKAEEWRHAPWDPVLYSASYEDKGDLLAWPDSGDRLSPECRLYARAAGDDKAPLIALLAGLDALQANNIPLTSHLVFLFEGEEEIGSPYLRDYMEKFRSRFAADLWLIFDGPMHQSGRPQLVFGVRGIVGFEMVLYGANRGLHSGHYGNWAPNPALQMAQLLATMKDDRGRVRIDGFYDSVKPLGLAERRALLDIPDMDDDLRREFGLSVTEAANANLAERLLLPSLNIRGFVSGGVGAQARNVIPSKATAALDIRLVPDNEPEAMLDLVERHMEGQGFRIVRSEPDAATRAKYPKLLQLTRGKGYRSVRTSMDDPWVRELADLAAAAADGFGTEERKETILTPSLGGSLPLYLFQDVLKAPLVIVPIANYDNNQHAPNENLRIGNLWYGIDLMGGILTMP